MSKSNTDVEAVSLHSTQTSVDSPKHTDQELVAELRRVAEAVDGPLSEREYAERGTFGLTTYRRRFGSWNAAKREAGLGTEEWERIDDERLLEDLERVARGVDGPVSERVYAERGSFGVTTLRRRFGSWNAAKGQLGLETERREVTEAAIADDIARVADDLDVAYVTPQLYAEHGEYPLAVLPTDDTFWGDLRERLGLSITPLYHKVAFDSGSDG